MIINGKPTGYLFFYCTDHRQWSESRDIDNILVEFDLEQETREDFTDLVDFAVEFGKELAKDPKLSDLDGDGIAARAINEFTSTSDFVETVAEAYENEDEEYHEHIKAAVELCHEALVNSLYYEFKKRED